MRRVITFLGLALLAAGCGGSKTPTAEAPAAATGRPGADEAKACIATYLGQCGCKDVELVSLAERPDVPAGAKIPGEAWAYTFSAKYTDLFGERRASENWVAVLARADGKPCLKSCFDDAKRLVGGHSGEEVVEKGVLTPGPAGEDAPVIIAPKP
jgi:hypothetical protein